jgi:hypothetical protein
MGKKSKKKTSGAAASRQQNTNGSDTNNIGSRNVAASPSTPSASVANAATGVEEEEELMEPIAGFDMDAWEAGFPYAEKTSDPRAQELDKAHEIGARL